VGKVWAALSLITAVAIIAAPGASFVASVINHNSFYDYPQFWWYYQYLGLWAGVFFIITFAVAIWARMVGPTDDEEDDNDDSEGSNL
jgi:hypothetical protein